MQELDSVTEPSTAQWTRAVASGSENPFTLETVSQEGCGAHFRDQGLQVLLVPPLETLLSKEAAILSLLLPGHGDGESEGEWSGCSQHVQLGQDSS